MKKIIKSGIIIILLIVAIQVNKSLAQSSIDPTPAELAKKSTPAASVQKPAHTMDVKSSIDEVPTATKPSAEIKPKAPATHTAKPMSSIDEPVKAASGKKE